MTRYLNGNPLCPEEVTNIVREYTQRLGDERRITPHALRRSCATELIKGGANPGHVKDILGHENFESLQAYVRLAAVDVKEALRKCHPRER